MTLTDFLLARITEDESDGRGCTNDYGDIGVLPSRDYVKMSPTRFYAECEARRRIVEEHKLYPLVSEFYCSSCGDVPQIEYPCVTLRLLALPYADHPDYCEEWRP